jgi:hypothetical protein
VVDAYFSKAPFINGMIAASIGVISRLRHDAKGWDDAPPYSGRGRPRKYGKEWKLADLLTELSPMEVTVRVYGKLSKVHCVVRDVWLRGIEQKVRVVAIEGIRRPVLLISTDLSLSAVAIIEMYAARFSLEIAIRDLKQYFGFGHYQCYTTISIFRFVHLCCTSFCLFRCMLMQEQKAPWLLDASPKMVDESPISFARAKRSLRQFAIKGILFSKSADSADFQKARI